MSVIHIYSAVVTVRVMCYVWCKLLNMLHAYRVRRIHFRETNVRRWNSMRMGKFSVSIRQSRSLNSCLACNLLPMEPIPSTCFRLGDTVSGKFKFQRCRCSYFLFTHQIFGGAKMSNDKFNILPSPGLFFLLLHGCKAFLPAQK
jgi:hypothetical protein